MAGTERIRHAGSKHIKNMCSADRHPSWSPFSWSPSQLIAIQLIAIPVGLIKCYHSSQNVISQLKILSHRPWSRGTKFSKDSFECLKTWWKTYKKNGLISLVFFLNNTFVWFIQNFVLEINIDAFWQNNNFKLLESIIFVSILVPRCHLKTESQLKLWEINTFFFIFDTKWSLQWMNWEPSK